MSKSEKREFWNARAWKREYSGTNDLMIKQLEMKELTKHFVAGADVLEVGCGNGETALTLAKQFDLNIDAFDFSEEMIEAALADNAGAPRKVNFQVADVRAFQPDKKYDLIYSKRALINLDSWAEQQKAIEQIVRWLKPGGRFLMCENSLDALDRINQCRTSLSLGVISPPWHNVYFSDANLESLELRDAILADTIPFSSTYYFLSRVVNAALASQAGQEPSYDSPINQLSLKLPPFGDFSQTKLWIWEARRAS